MKQQIARLSPHQNGKVFAVISAVMSLVFLVPFFLMFAAFGPSESRPPVFVFIALPVIYLIVGYVGTALACAIYNVVYKWVGGVEFESFTP